MEYDGVQLFIFGSGVYMVHVVEGRIFFIIIYYYIQYIFLFLLLLRIFCAETML